VFLQPIDWGKNYNIITHHRHYQELVKEVTIVGLPTPSEATQASDFIYSLSPDFSKMQDDLRNNEIWVKTPSEELMMQLNYTLLQFQLYTTHPRSNLMLP